MNDRVGQCQDKQPEWPQDLAVTIGLALKGFFGEEAFENILSDCREQAVTDLEEVVNDIELDGCLATDPMVHPAGVKF